MRTATYQVQLKPEEHEQLESMLRKGKHAVKELKRAQVLLLAHEGKSNREIQDRTGLSEPTVIAHKRRYVQEGLTLKDKPRRPKRPKLDSRQETYLMAIACSPAPEGRTSWTMQLMADKLVELEVVESISDETVRLALKKMRSNPGSKKRGALAPK